MGFALGSSKVMCMTHVREYSCPGAVLLQSSLKKFKHLSSAKGKYSAPAPVILPLFLDSHQMKGRTIGELVSAFDYNM